MIDFFDHIYVINLDHRKDRWSRIQNTLKHFKGKITRIPAVERKRGWLGCYYSHAAVLEAAQKEIVKHVLVLEDDAEFFPDWEATWEKAKYQIPERWDMLYLGYNLDISCRKPDSIHLNMLRLFGCLTTHAYGIHWRALDRLAMTVYDEKKPIDQIYKDLRFFDTFGVYPLMINQTDDYSDINKRHMKNRFRDNVRQIVGR
jgi:GR25 family glycosyltransferase involved in LPS biosynthesis